MHEDGTQDHGVLLDDGPVDALLPLFAVARELPVLKVRTLQFREGNQRFAKVSD